MLLRARELGVFVHIAEPLLLYHAPAWSAVAPKYSAGRRRLLAILGQRYGKRAWILQRELKRMYASSYLQQALQQIDSREISAAALSLARSMRCDPLFAIRCCAVGQAFSKRNLTRLKRLWPSGGRRGV